MNNLIDYINELQKDLIKVYQNLSTKIENVYNDIYTLQRTNAFLIILSIIFAITVTIFFVLIIKNIKSNEKIIENIEVLQKNYEIQQKEKFEKQIMYIKNKIQ